MKRTTIRTTLLAAGLVPLALGFTGSALAGGPISECAASGQPYVWPDGGADIPFNPDLGDLGPVSNADAVAAVSDSFAVWGAVGSSTASYVNAGPLPEDVDVDNFIPYIDPAAPDGYSAIVFDDTGEIFDLLYGPGSGVLGFAGYEWVNTVECTVLEGLSFLNGPSFDDLVAAFDVMVHEFGHYSGLGHTVVNGQIYIGDTTGPTPDDPQPVVDPFGSEVVETMYPFYFGPGIGTGSLHLDDIQALSELYPAPEFATDTAVISGTVYLPDGVTPVTGVNVIARNPESLASWYLDAASAISGDVNDAGQWEISGLTPGVEYVVYIDEIIDGGFSTPLASPFPGPEEYYNGAGESNNVDSSDPVDESTPVLAGTSGVDIVFNAPAPGDPLLVGDDGFVLLQLEFNWEICGQRYDSVYINANGHLTFGAPDGDFSPTAGEFLAGPPRIAPLWTDLSPFNLFTGVQQGLVTFDSSRHHFSMIFEDVPAFPDVGANSFEVTLKRFGGIVQVDYGDLSAETGIAGMSCGGAITSGFEEGVDLSREARGRKGWINMILQTATFEELDPVDLGNDFLTYSPTHRFEDWWAGRNDTQRKAKKIPLPFDSESVLRYTEIEPVGDDIDWFRFKKRSKSGALIVEITGGQLDSLIRVITPSGDVIDDDDGGAGLLSRVVVEDAPKGWYYVAVTTFGDDDFTGEGTSGGRYVLDTSVFDGVFVSLGDDDTVEVPLEFSFPFNGASYDSVFVNSNGSISFGSGDTEYAYSVPAFLGGPPRIAPLFVDFSPQLGGEVFVEYGNDSATVVFDSIPEYFWGGSNTFMVTLRADGSFTVDYGAMTGPEGLAGTTEGGGAADPGETDLGAAGALPAAGTTYELFDFSGDTPVNDLEGVSLDYEP